MGSVFLGATHVTENKTSQKDYLSYASTLLCVYYKVSNYFVIARLRDKFGPVASYKLVVVLKDCGLLRSLCPLVVLLIVVLFYITALL